MPLYPSQTLYPSPTLYPNQAPTGGGSGGGDDTPIPEGEQAISCEQIGADAIRITWHMNPVGSGFRLAVEVGGPEPLDVQQLPANRNSYIARDLYPGLTYTIRINNLQRSFTLSDVTSSLVINTDGWHSAAPAGAVATLERNLVDAGGSTSTMLQEEVRAVSAGSYDPTASRVARTFNNLIRGQQYVVSFSLRRTRMDALMLNYQATVRAKLSSRSYSAVQRVLGTSAVLDLAPLPDTLHPAKGVVGFTATASTMEFVLAGYGNTMNVNAGALVEAIEIAPLQLRRLVPAALVNDVAQQMSISAAFDLTMNSVDGSWYIDKLNREQFVLNSDAGASPVLYFADHEADGKLFFDSDSAQPTNDTSDLVNNLAVTNHRTAARGLSTDTWAADDVTKTYKLDASIAKFRAKSANVEWCVYDDGQTLNRRAAAALARFGLPKKAIDFIETNAQQNPKAFFQLEINDHIYVELDGWVQESRVLKLNHSIDAASNRWLVQIKLLPIALRMASETFAEFNAAETANTFAEFNAKWPDTTTFKTFNKTWRKP